MMIDDRLFLSINHLPHTPIFDTVALTLSGIGNAGLIWFFLGVLLFIREERKDFWFFVPIAMAGAIAGIVVEILKQILARPRPTELLDAIVVSSAHGYSFPSGHATMAFALATVLSAKEPKWRWWFFILAVLISLSRIYMGVHYPLDVIGGAMIGWAIGRLSIYFGARVKKKSD